MQKIQGFVEKGNTTLLIGQAAGVIAQKVQGSFPGATITVYINSAPAVAISSISRAANVVTVTIPSGSGFIAGEQVTIASVTDASFNGTFTIIVSGATTFTYAQVAGNASSSGGTASSTLRLATIYSDNSSTSKANPFVSASDGTWFFYAPNGHYDVKFSGAGIAAPFTLGDFSLFDESSLWIDVTAAPYFAKGDGIADDTVALQAAIDAARGSLSGGIYSAVKYVLIPDGNYKITSTLRLYADKAYWGMWLKGSGKWSTKITYAGPTNTSAIRMIGAFQKISDLQLFNSAGWLDGIQYDGDAAIGISTSGKISDVFIEGNSQSGNGITCGRSAFQADHLEIDHPFITALTSGRAVWTMDSNALSVNLIAPSIGHCWIAVQTNTSTDFAIFGGEIDDNDVNFFPGSGGSFSVYGVRSEGSMKQFVSGNGVVPQPVTFVNYLLASDYVLEHPAQKRPAATCTSTDATHITLSNAGPTWCDYIIIAGAGVAGVDLHTRIASMTDPTHAILDTAAIATPVVGAAVTYDTTVEQNAFYEGAGGPYVHQSCYFNIASGSQFNAANGTQIFTGNGWRQNITTPFGTIFPLLASWTGNYYNELSTSKMTDWTSALLVTDVVYGAGWNSSSLVPTRNAVYDKIETVTAGETAALVSDAVYGAGWNGVATIAPSKNAVYDKLEALIATLPTSGTYSPTITAVANIDAISALTAQYTRIGNIVTVGGVVGVNCTTGGLTSQIRISLPVASTLSAVEKLGGAGCNGSRDAATVQADTVNNQALVSWVTSTTTDQYVSYTFTYLVT